MKEEKIFNRNYILLMVINTLLFISFNIVNPVLPKHVTDLGMSVTAAGIISGCFSITSLIFRPLCGMAADRLNPKKMYVFAGIMMSVACAGYSFFDSFAGLFAVRILHGIFFAVATTVCLVMVTYFIPKGKMGQGIGFFGIGQIVAISFAPGLGLKVGGALGYGFSFLIASLMALIATVLSLLLSYEHSKTETERSEEVKIEVTEKNVSFSIKKIIAFDVIIFAVLAGLFSFSNSIEYTFMALYSEAKGIEDISIYFTVSAVFILISRLFAGKIYDEKGLSVILYPAFLVAAVSMFVLGHANTLWVFLIAAALKALGQGSGQPSLHSESLLTAGKDRRGIASSTYYLGPDIMQGIGPVVGGIIIDHAGYQTMYYLCGILLLAGMAVYAVYMKVIR